MLRTPKPEEPLCCWLLLDCIIEEGPEPDIVDCPCAVLENVDDSVVGVCETAMAA